MSALSVNKTIDDTKLRDDWTEANVTYSNGWAARPYECPTCLLKPDENLVMDGTWHYSRTNLSDVKTPMSFTLAFPGTAIYVYGVAFKKTTFERNEFVVTNLSFTLDGQPSLPNYYADPLASGYQYNTLVYSQAGLKNDTHILQVALVNDQDSPRFNAFLFDYANYTFEASSSGEPLQTTSETVTSTSSPQSLSSPAYHHLTVGAIVGITLGILALVCLAIGIPVFYFLRRRGQRRELAPDTVADLLSPAEDKPDSQGYLTDTLSPASLHRTSPNGTSISKQREASALRAEFQQLEARNARYSMLHTMIPPTYDETRR